MTAAAAPLLLTHGLHRPKAYPCVRVCPPVLHSSPVLENTTKQAASRPVSAALSRPDFKVLGGMGLPVRMAARLASGFQHPAHPLRLKTLRRVVSQFSKGT